MVGVFLLSLVTYSASAQAPPTAPVNGPAPAAPPAPLTLAAATAEALSLNPAATAAQQQFVQAQARRAQADAQRHSQITLDTTGGISNANVYQPPPTQETFGELDNTLTFPLPIGRKPRLALQQADAQVTTAQAQLDSARLALAGQVSAAYYDLLRKQALQKIAEETQASAQRQLDEAQKRFRAGDAPELDVLRAQVPVATAEAALYQAQNATMVARQTLASLLNRPLDAPLTVADVTAPAADSLAFTFDEARAQALKSNPDVRAAEANIRASELGRQVAGQAREPTYALQASDIRSGDVTGFSRQDRIQATITFPLSDGGLARAQQKEADATLAQAKAQAESARRTTEAAVSAAYLNAQSGLRQIDAARRAQEIAQTSYDKTGRGYQAGLYPLTDVLNAQSALNQARIAYTQAIYDAAAAISALNLAVGNLPTDTK
jgi:outer membrane protein